MPFNGPGIYSAPASSWNPAANNTDIDATDWAALLADISTALSTALLKDGTSTPSAQIKFFAGTVSVPGIAIGETGTGFYRIGTNNWGFAANGVQSLGLGTGSLMSVNGFKTSSGVTPSTASGVAVSVINPAAFQAGLYLVYAYLPGAGTIYQAAAIFSADGTNANLLQAFNGANMVIDGGGQATQTSGISQVISFKYFQISG